MSSSSLFDNFSADRRTSGLVTAVLACVILSDLILQLNERASFTGVPTQFMMLHDAFWMAQDVVWSIVLMLTSACLFFNKRDRAKAVRFLRWVPFSLRSTTGQRFHRISISNLHQFPVNHEIVFLRNDDHQQP